MGSSRRVVPALTAVALWSTNAYAAGQALQSLSVGWLQPYEYAATTAAGKPAPP